MHFSPFSSHHKGCWKKNDNILGSTWLMRIYIALLRQLKCIIIVRISQTHKYNDLRVSKLLATNEINMVPSEFEIICYRRWWEMIHLSCYLWNSSIEIYLPGLEHLHCSSHPVEFVRRSLVPADFQPPILISHSTAWVNSGLEPLILFTGVGILPIISFSQETLMCSKVRLMLNWLLNMISHFYNKTWYTCLEIKVKLFLLALDRRKAQLFMTQIVMI